MVKKFIQGFRAKFKPEPFSREKVESISFKAELAKRILDNPLMAEIFDRIEKQLFEIWKNSTPAEGEQREITYYRLEAIQKVQNMINGYLNQARYENHLVKLQTEDSEEQGG